MVTVSTPNAYIFMERHHVGIGEHVAVGQNDAASGAVWSVDVDNGG